VAGKSKQEVYEQGQAAKVPTSFSASPMDLLRSAQYAHRGFFVETEHLEAGAVHVPGLPFQWDGMELPRRAAPLLGEHNQEVYCGLLGLDRDDLKRLFAAGVI
jgi:crotonobetainyl-CoA:carnitine CoA-transferase CaiB-like acyl-CoA transferase